MVRRLKISRSATWPKVDNRIKTKNVPIVGFEWEVPADWDKVRWSQLDDRIQETYDLGFFNHVECGCVEFCSPTANTIAVARTVAKTLKKYTKKARYLGCYNKSGNDGGIHVSVSDPAAEDVSGNLFWKMLAVLNRRSSKDFVWEFSGRGRGRNSGDYLAQAQSTCWDAYGAVEPSGEDYDEMEDYCMLRNQYTRIEFRLWWNHEDLLIPAIEFAHSFYIFMSKQKGERIPYLKDYKQWLFKQKGYKILKSNKAWSLVE